MKPKRVIFWAVFGFCAYQLFGYFKTHTDPDVVTYKRFAKAVVDQNDYVLKTTAEQNVFGNAGVLKASNDKQLEGFEQIITYYVINSHRKSPDGRRAYIQAEQVTRVNPEGIDSFWGKEVIRIPHTVELFRDGDAWKIVEFRAPVVTG